MGEVHMLPTQDGSWHSHVDESIASMAALVQESFLWHARYPHTVPSVTAIAHAVQQLRLAQACIEGHTQPGQGSVSGVCSSMTESAAAARAHGRLKAASAPCIAQHM